MGYTFWSKIVYPTPSPEGGSMLLSLPAFLLAWCSYLPKVSLFVSYTLDILIDLMYLLTTDIFTNDLPSIYFMLTTAIVLKYNSNTYKLYFSVHPTILIFIHCSNETSDRKKSPNAGLQRFLSREFYQSVMRCLIGVFAMMKFACQRYSCLSCFWGMF